MAEGGEDGVAMGGPRMVVRMGDAKKRWEENPIPPIRLEDVISAEERFQSPGGDAVDSPSSSSNLWQVYALGTFFVSKWIWARWQERRNRGFSGSSNGDD